LKQSQWGDTGQLLAQLTGDLGCMPGVSLNSIKDSYSFLEQETLHFVVQYWLVPGIKFSQKFKKIFTIKLK